MVAQVAAEELVAPPGELFVVVLYPGLGHRFDPCMPCRLLQPGDVGLQDLYGPAISNLVACYAVGVVRHQSRMCSV